MAPFDFAPAAVSRITAAGATLGAATGAAAGSAVSAVARPVARQVNQALDVVVPAVVDALIARIDLNALIARNVDIDALAATLDLEAIVYRLDPIGVGRGDHGHALPGDERGDSGDAQGLGGGMKEVERGADRGEHEHDRDLDSQIGYA